MTTPNSRVGKASGCPLRQPENVLGVVPVSWPFRVQEFQCSGKVQWRSSGSVVRLLLMENEQFYWPDD